MNQYINGSGYVYVFIFRYLEILNLCDIMVDEKT